MHNAMDAKSRSRRAQTINLIGAINNFVLAIIKVVFGWLGHSQALVADGIHSFSDLLTDVLVIFATHFGSRGADSDHPYGHQRIETAATLLLALLLILTGAGIVYESVREFLHPSVQLPTLVVLIVAALSILANEILFHATRKVGREIKSNLLIANAWHHRSDAASSLIVLIGVAMTLFGWVVFDAIAAMIVGVMIIRMGWQLGWSSVRELVDTGVEPELLTAFENTIQHVPGVFALHQLRTRSMGSEIFLDVHVLVAPRLSVSEGHFIARSVRQTLQSQHQHIADVTVHIDPEDDEIVDAEKVLPTREELDGYIHQVAVSLPGGGQIEEIILHYLADQVEVEISLPTHLSQQDGISKAYYDALIQHPAISTIRLVFR